MDKAPWIPEDIAARGGIKFMKPTKTSVHFKEFRRTRTMLERRKLFKKILYRPWRFGAVDGIPRWLYDEAAAWRSEGRLKPLRKPNPVIHIGTTPPPASPYRLVERAPLRCPACAQTFWVCPSAVRLRLFRYCSDECRQAATIFAHYTLLRPVDRERYVTFQARLNIFSLCHLYSREEKNQAQAAHVIKDLYDVMAMSKMVTDRPTLTLGQMNTLRIRAEQVVSDTFTDASAVLKGDKSWSPQQVKLFLGILDKLLPNATPPRDPPPRDPTMIDITKLSRAELEALAAQAEPIDVAFDALGEPEDDDSPQPPA